MNKYFLFIIAVLIVNTELFSQTRKLPFKLTGTINTRDTGTMILQAVNSSLYYPFNSGLFKTEVKEGRFSFSGQIAYPASYMIGFMINGQWQYLSSNFFIDSGDQTINCIMGNNRMPPEINNTAMEELLNEYEKSIAPINRELNDSTLLLYTRKHPSSYVALWELIDEFSSGYKPVYDGIYNQFSEKIKTTFTGKALKRQLDSARKTCIGCTFPNIKLPDRNSLNGKSNLFKDSHDYVLVDFWFSHCTPCISQFQKLKVIYNQYKKSGFEIIGISTDPQDQIKNWGKVIDNNTLPWPQYLDENGAFAKSISINQFPSNFLLDRNGNIVKRDISPEELDTFLSNAEKVK